MTIDEMIAVLEAAKRGEPLQALDSCNPNRGWFDIEPPLGPPLRNFEQYALRVKPREPQTIYAIWFCDCCGLSTRFYNTRADAESVLVESEGRHQIVEFREVLP